MSSIPTRKYLHIVYSFVATGGTLGTVFTFNNDTGNNYCSQQIVDGAFTTTTSAASVSGESGTTDSGQAQGGYIDIFLNNATNEKNFHFVNISQDAAGAATIPVYVDKYGKWANTSAVISRIDFTNPSGTGDFAAASEIIVLGHN